MIDIVKTLQKGLDFHASGDLRNAELAYRQVLEVHPDHPDAIHFLGVLAFNANQNETAKELLLKATELSPDNSACYLNMGNVLQQEGDFKKAVEWYEKSKALNPSNPKLYNNIGVGLSRIGLLEESADNLKKAIDLESNYAEAHNNLSETYKFMGQYDLALKSSEQALKLAPDSAAVRWNRSILMLLTGDLRDGFKEYEWRWRRPQLTDRSISAGQRWQGQELNGKIIFVYEEQGLGDTLQFLRYLPYLKKLGAVVVLEAVTTLIRLFETFDGYDRLWVGIKNKDTRPSDRFDFYTPLLSIPGIMNTSLENIPDNTPYLKADIFLAKIWKNRMKGDHPGLKIGVVWAGHCDHSNDKNRSVHLSHFKRLDEITDILLFSLQKEKHAYWTDTDPDQIFEKDLGEEISDFADTAAIIENLDLVISVDTAVVHLAGAMGKEVWTLLPFSPDWRWLLEREDSPWYPTMRLFRQPAPGDWGSVFADVKVALLEKIRQK